jgi:hypothetical protein
MLRQGFNKKCIVLLLLLCSVGGVTTAMAAETVYLKYNVHVQEQIGRDGAHIYKASYSGWVDPLPPFFVVPAGSAVTIGRSRSGFTLTPQAEPKEIVFEFKEKHMGMSLDEYLAQITSPQPVALDRFSKTDRAGIRAGKAQVGMSKDGVLTALGIPPRHKTPSLDENSWTYWKDKYRTLVVEFDGTGTVKSIRQ